MVLAPASTVEKAKATWTLANPPPAPPPPIPYSSWNQFVSPGVKAKFSSDPTAPFHGLNSINIEHISGSGVAAMGNRGLGNEGLFIEALKDYEGYFFAKSAKPVKLVAQLINTKSNVTLGSTVLDFAGGNWTMLNFSISTTAGTSCVDGTNDPSVKCGKMGASPQ